MYPPLDVPKPIAEGVWLVDSGPQDVLGFALPIRMTVLRLADGGLWLHSPTRHTADLAAALQALGPVRHLVSPSTAHWVHLPSWQAAFPEALLWTPPEVVERARGQGVTLRSSGVLGGAPPAAWAGEIAQDVIRGRGYTEIAFHHVASRTLVLTDFIQALDTARLPIGFRLVVRLLGVAAPAGGTPRHLRFILRPHRADNRAAAERLVAADPARVVFAHGAIFAIDGAARLRRALEWLLR